MTRLSTWVYPKNVHISLVISSVVRAFRLKYLFFRQCCPFDSRSCIYSTYKVSTSLLDFNNLSCHLHEIATKLLRYLSSSFLFLTATSALRFKDNFIYVSKVTVYIDWRHLHIQVLLISTFYQYPHDITIKLHRNLFLSRLLQVHFVTNISILYSSGHVTEVAKQKNWQYNSSVVNINILLCHSHAITIQLFRSLDLFINWCISLHISQFLDGFI